MRGMTGSGDGVHILTGPIYVDKAEPGDILKVEILDLYPRVNRNGEAYGVNAAAWWGFHYGTSPVCRRLCVCAQCERDGECSLSLSLALSLSLSLSFSRSRSRPLPIPHLGFRA